LIGTHNAGLSIDGLPHTQPNTYLLSQGESISKTKRVLLNRLPVLLGGVLKRLSVRPLGFGKHRCAEALTKCGFRSSRSAVGRLNLLLAVDLRASLGAAQILGIRTSKGLAKSDAGLILAVGFLPLQGGVVSIEIQTDKDRWLGGAGGRDVLSVTMGFCAVRHHG